MKMEEKQMELDAQLRREDRQLQFQLVQMLTQQSSTSRHFHLHQCHTMGYTPKIILGMTRCNTGWTVA